MKVICAGMNKTGTKSISEALRQLGFTVYDWEEQLFDFLDYWVDVFQNGAKPDVKALYQNADAVVDIPGNLFWEEILETFPDCKVILSERDEDSWIQSWVNHLEMIHATRVEIRKSFIAYKLSQSVRKLRYIVDSCIYGLLGSTNPKSTCVFRKRYRMHNHRVKSIVPPAKLLVFNVKQGWKPLCDFLGCEVPTSAFPHENIKGEILTKAVKMKRFRRQVISEVRKGCFWILSIIVVIVASSVSICYFSSF